MTKTYLIEIEISSTNKDKKRYAINVLKKNGFRKIRKKGKHWQVIKTIEPNKSAQQIQEFVKALFNSIDNVSIHIKTEIKNNRS